MDIGNSHSLSMRLRKLLALFPSSCAEIPKFLVDKVAKWGVVFFG